MSPRDTVRPKAGLVVLFVLLTALSGTQAYVGAPPSASTRLTLAAAKPAKHWKVGKVLWSGDFERGGIPHGANGRRCGTGKHDGPDSRRDQYRAVEEMGNSACTNQVRLSRGLTRTRDSRRSLKIVMGARQQREVAASKFHWTPNRRGSVDHWYGFSLYYAADWQVRGGLAREVSGSSWHSPIGWRMAGGNGSLNLSGDLNMSNANGHRFQTFRTPHMILRRNTVMNNGHFYKDGKGLDKLDLGPIVTRRWMDFVCHIRWSTTAHNAVRECWRDGRYMGAKHSRNAVGARSHELRVGQYQDTNLRHRRTTYVDNVRIGTSFRAVDPARSR